MNRSRDDRGRGMLLMEPALLKFHRYLLVLAHARSFSTLLCHILGSHPRICGYSEAMIPYQTAVDLIRLNSMVSRAGNYRGDSEYVVDKLILDNFDVSDVVLRIPRVTPLLIIREPESSIRSLVRMRTREYEQGIADWTGGMIDRARNAELAAVYYIARLGTLRVMVARLEAMGKRALFLTAESLMADTAATFRWLERELGLSEPLCEEYRLFPNTGAVGSGDTSATIRSGRIVRDRDEREEAPIAIPRSPRPRPMGPRGMPGGLPRVARPVPRRGMREGPLQGPTATRFDGSMRNDRSPAEPAPTTGGPPKGFLEEAAPAADPRR